MTPDILVTGGTGALGKVLCQLLEKQSIPFKVAARNPQPHQVKLDLETGEGIEEAVKGIKTIFHLASGTKAANRKIEVEGTEKLLQAAKKEGITHFIYISIVGIEKVSMTYYQYKLEAEKIIQQSEVPFSILRATQFHGFIEGIFQRLAKMPLIFFPTHIQFQPIEVEMVAKRLVEIAQLSPSNQIENLGGSEILESGQMMKMWLKSKNLQKWILPLPLLWGKLKTGLEKGGLTCKEKAMESKTWQAYLNEGMKE